ncbi:MAG: hypothetical protein NC349_02550 [Paenibacillus sp.]|nr:hypothetical protein [Paenibacillus sp.]
MKLKSILPVIFIILLSAITFTACDAEDEPQYIDINNNLQELTYSKVLSDGHTMNNQSYDSTYIDSLLMSRSVIAIARIEFDRINSECYYCKFSYGGLDVYYVSNSVLLLPPDEIDGINIYYNTSELGDVTYFPTYSVIYRQPRGKGVHIGVTIKKLYMGTWTVTEKIDMTVAFDGSVDAKIMSFDKKKRV